MKKKYYKEMAQAGAKWWADQLCNPSGPQDKIVGEGEEFPGGGLGRAFVSFAHTTVDEINDDQISVFEKELEKLIYKVIKSFGGWSFIGVDYGPCPTLTKAAEKAGINLDLRLPLKTNMTLDPTKLRVAVSQGYGAASVEVYSYKEEE